MAERQTEKMPLLGMKNVDRQKMKHADLTSKVDDGMQISKALERKWRGKTEHITVDMRERIHSPPQTTTSTHTHSPPTATDTAAKGTTSTHTHSPPTASDDPGSALASNVNVASSHSLTRLLLMMAAITLQPSHGDSSTNPRPPPGDPDSPAIPQPRVYRAWECFMLIWAFICSYGTPFMFGVYNDSDISIPVLLIMFDGASTLIGLIDLFVEIWMWVKGFTAKGINGWIWCLLDIFGCIPWFIIFKKKKHDADAERFAYRALELILVFFFWLHLEGCVFHYLATIPPPPLSECDSCATWLTSLELRDGIDYSDITNVAKWKRYFMSLYFALITMSTVGYGAIHPVNFIEMVFAGTFVVANFVVTGYLCAMLAVLIEKLSTFAPDKSSTSCQEHSRGIGGRRLQHRNEALSIIVEPFRLLDEFNCLGA
ncbi:hypothetical protein FNV43_RR12525 [Rhamnella rubrinervis]|uniref:Potassium channel domain-containing protein n=1 Tax=Rhamnella rubrinervis TaxID=2594499 RepID=A0A8K0H814_9ROSA|nr:hypothetical protein FNV43_RR12525 [Rhamnella rubrinervis]